MGNGQVTFDASDPAGGIYFYYVQARNAKCTGVVEQVDISALISHIRNS
jgi:hypothetical protein